MKPLKIVPMANYFTDISFGETLPINNPHAVSVSLPEIADIIEYEEGNTDVISKMKSGYPRFFTNYFVKQLVDFTKKENNISDNKGLIPITSIQAKNIIDEKFNTKLDFILDSEKNVFLVVEIEDVNTKKYVDFIRNTGLLISSRKAENTLYKFKEISSIFKEEQVKLEQAYSNIKNTLSLAYKTASENIVLANCGMNALFTAIEACLLDKKKSHIIQLGWLYVDTMEIIENKDNYHVQINIYNLDQLENWLYKNSQNVAVLVTEVVSNPLLQCVNLPKLYEICNRFSIKLVVDSTLGTPFCVDVLPYCDIAVESLTKFACGNADLLFGAVITNDNSLFETISNKIIPPFEGEIKRLGFEILEYENRIKKISENTLLLNEYFMSQSKIKEVKSVLEPKNFENYSKIQKNNLVPGLLSVIFDKDLAFYYDKLKLAKGPSLGTEFTLAMPYVYLAHYNDLKSEKGLHKLKELEINPNLLRISVGTEPIEEIIATFDKVLNE